MRYYKMGNRVVSLEEKGATFLYRVFDEVFRPLYSGEVAADSVDVAIVMVKRVISSPLTDASVRGNVSHFTNALRLDEEDCRDRLRVARMVWECEAFLSLLKNEELLTTDELFNVFICGDGSELILSVLDEHTFSGEWYSVGARFLMSNLLDYFQEKFPKVLEFRTGTALRCRAFKPIDAEREVKDYIREKLAGLDIHIMNVMLTGSYAFGTANSDSDLDIVMFYYGEIKEDFLFNILHGDDVCTFDGIRVDINPINIKYTDIEAYLSSVMDYNMTQSRKRAAV